ncbi:MAG: hypothetical protein IKW90_15100 [Lachnospiraceae bacterium]|nr:hypothetical protein [Lachnospiraceae bacterium]
MQELYELRDKLCKELKEYSKKDKLDSSSLQIVDTLAHSLKNVCKIIESYEMEDGYSNASMPRMPRMSYAYDDMSYARGRGANARRDSMGRYSSRDGGGYSSHGDFRTEMQDLMNQAPNDYVRQKMMEAMNGM